MATGLNYISDKSTTHQIPEVLQKRNMWLGYCSILLSYYFPLIVHIYSEINQKNQKQRIAKSKFCEAFSFSCIALLGDLMSTIPPWFSKFLLFFGNELITKFRLFYFWSSFLKMFWFLFLFLSYKTGNKKKSVSAIYKSNKSMFHLLR